MDAKLKVPSGSFSGQTIQVPHGKLVIGREEDCDLRLESELVSGYQCALLLDEYALRIRDLGSTNGTFMNGRWIGTSEMILLQDDMISIDKMTFQVDLAQATTGLQPAAPKALPAASPAAFQGTGLFDVTVDVGVPTVPSQSRVPSVPMREVDVLAERGNKGRCQPKCTIEA